MMAIYSKSATACRMYVDLDISAARPPAFRQILASMGNESIQSSLKECSLSQAQASCANRQGKFNSLSVSSSPSISSGFRRGSLQVRSRTPSFFSRATADIAGYVGGALWLDFAHSLDLVVSPLGSYEYRRLPGVNEITHTFRFNISASFPPAMMVIWWPYLAS